VQRGLIIRLAKPYRPANEQRENPDSGECVVERDAPGGQIGHDQREHLLRVKAQDGVCERVAAMRRVKRILHLSGGLDRTTVDREQHVPLANGCTRARTGVVDGTGCHLIALVHPQHTIVGLRPRTHGDVCRPEAEQHNDDGRFEGEPQPDADRPQAAGLRFCLQTNGRHERCLGRQVAKGVPRLASPYRR